MVRDRENLVRDISAVLNMHSVDNQANTPDFILAEMVVKMLEAVSGMNETRDRWFKASDVEKDVLRLWNDEQLLLETLDRAAHDGTSMWVEIEDTK